MANLQHLIAALGKVADAYAPDAPDPNDDPDDADGALWTILAVTLMMMNLIRTRIK